MAARARRIDKRLRRFRPYIMTVPPLLGGLLSGLHLMAGEDPQYAVAMHLVVVDCAYLTIVAAMSAWFLGAEFSVRRAAAVLAQRPDPAARQQHVDVLLAGVRGRPAIARSAAAALADLSPPAVAELLRAHRSAVRPQLGYVFEPLIAPPEGTIVRQALLAAIEQARDVTYIADVRTVARRSRDSASRLAAKRCLSVLEVAAHAAHDPALLLRPRGPTTEAAHLVRAADATTRSGRTAAVRAGSSRTPRVTAAGALGPSDTGESGTPAVQQPGPCTTSAGEAARDGAP